MSRIALVVSSFPKLSESFIMRKFAGLLAAGLDVHVVCTTSDVEEWKQQPQRYRQVSIRRRVHRVWAHRPSWIAAVLFAPCLVRCGIRNPRGSWRYLSRGWRRLGAGVFRAFYLDAELIGLAPDLVHFEFGSLAVGRMHLRHLLGCKLVVSFRGYDLNIVGLEEPSHYEEVWRGADGIHLLGEDLWRQAQRRGCPPGKRHVLIPPAVDPAEFPPATKETGGSRPGDRPFRILSVGRMDWRKGYEYSLQAVRQLIDRGVACEYRIVGDGEYRGLVAFARHRLELESVVELLGARDQEEVRRQLAWADVFLHGAVSEGFCNAVIEAQATALPVVCSDAGGLEENVADGVTGFVVPRRDPRALAEKLEVLARDSGLRRAMGAQARRRVEARFRLEDQLDRFGCFYDDVLGRRCGPALASGVEAERAGWTDAVRDGMKTTEGGAS